MAPPESAPVRGPVLCSGNLVMDLLARPVDALRWGATTPVEAIEQHLGGNGANTAYALARLGVPVRLLGMVGNDAFGEFVLQALRNAGVDLAAVLRSSAPTATTVALVNSQGERMFLHRPGSSTEMSLDPAGFPPSGWTAAHYHLASPFGLPRLRPHQPELLRRARSAGLTTSLDTHWDSAGRWMADLEPCLPHLDVLFVNQEEARWLTGLASPRESGRALHEKGARVVALKLGASGCLLFTPEGEFPCPAFQVPVVDTTGAGDCFVGGFLAAWLRRSSWLEAAHLANAVGALSVQRLGAVEGLLSYRETRRWMASAAAPR